MITPTEPTLTEGQERAWAADCAERVLHIYEGSHPEVPIPRRAIEAARLCAQGLIDPADARAATHASHAAADSADPRYGAGSAAGDAARAIRQAISDAAYAAGSAADGRASATSDAALFAAEAAADAVAERAWQHDRRVAYSKGEVPELDLFPGCSSAQREAALTFWRDGLMLAEATTAARVIVAPD
jgi:hypothetical protein